MKLRLLAFALLFCFFASACTDNILTTNEEDYNHTISVVQKPAIMKVLVEETGIISDGQDTELTAFMDSWRDRSRGDLTVAIPSNMDEFSGDIMEQLSEVAIKRGANRMIVLSDIPNDQDDNVITLRYDDYVAVAPDCQADRLELYGTKNRPMRSYGCASQHNLAKMIANPIDLVDPQLEESGTNAARRSITIQNTREGKPSPWLTTPSAGTSPSATSGSVK